MYMYCIYIQISPERLVQAGVSVSRVVQSAGEFVVIFPQSFTASVGCGFSVSESLCLAPASWFPLGCSAAQVCWSVCMCDMQFVASFWFLDQELISCHYSGAISLLIAWTVALLWWQHYKFCRGYNNNSNNNNYYSSCCSCPYWGDDVEKMPKTSSIWIGIKAFGENNGSMN